MFFPAAPRCPGPPRPPSGNRRDAVSPGPVAELRCDRARPAQRQLRGPSDQRRLVQDHPGSLAWPCRSLVVVERVRHPAS
jgi:hypothetical protein